MIRDKSTTWIQHTLKKRYWVPVVVLLTIPVGLKLPVFGGHPSAEDRERFASSIAFNQSKGIFENRRPELLEQMRSDSLSFELLKEWFSMRDAAEPADKLPEQMPDLAEFVEPAEKTKLIWLGHSTFLLNIDGVIVLVDPVFSDYASPLSFAAQRFQASVLSLDDLPQIDVILISHDHYDHLDQDSIEYFTQSKTQFVAPLGVGTHLKRWGIRAERIVEKDWWESHRVNTVEFTAAPAQHFSGRDGINNDETLWASWVITSSQSRLFYSGDSGYDIHFKEIGERYGPFDLSIMENGQYAEAWASVHMFPKETLQAHVDVRAEYLMPVHWGMYELAFHTWYEPVDTLARLAQEKGIELVTPIFGQLVVLDNSVETERWWEDLI